jgi:hypothetical protein
MENGVRSRKEKERPLSDINSIDIADLLNRLSSNMNTHLKYFCGIGLDVITECI